MNNEQLIFKTSHTFSDVIGYDAIKQELEIYTEYFNQKKEMENFGIELTKGILFYGPTGCGKTNFIESLIGTSKYSSYKISSTDLYGKTVQEGVNNVNLLFKLIEKNTIQVLYINNIDSFLTKENSNEYERTAIFNEFIKELDKLNNVLVIGETNNYEKVSEELLRAGRFDKKMLITQPLFEDRKAIIEYYLSNKVKSSDINVDIITKSFLGLSIVEIKAILNDAALNAYKNKKQGISHEYIMNSLLRFLNECSDSYDKVNSDLRLCCACHEAGHAIAEKMLLNHDICSVSIIGDINGAGGYTLSTPSEEFQVQDVDRLESKIISYYAGRAAESLYGFKNTIGASCDFEMATNELKEMFTVYGTYNKYILNQEALGIDIDSSSVIYRDMYKKANELMKKTIEFLTENIDILEDITNKLLENEIIYGNEIDTIINKAIKKRNKKKKSSNK